MYTKRTTITNETGLHTRPATLFTQKAGEFESDIQIGRVDGDKMVNAKSTIHLLTLGLSQNTEVEITAKGDDAETAVDALVNLIEEEFGE